jgi:hypothetical protein
MEGNERKEVDERREDVQEGGGSVKHEEGGSGGVS